MAVSENDGSVKFLYGTVPGRAILKLLMKLHLDSIAVRFLRSPLSRGYAKRYIKKYDIELFGARAEDFRTFRDFFVRVGDRTDVDMEPSHLISPCDGYLSAYSIGEGSTFSIKGSRYSIRDFLCDDKLANDLLGGDCLIFRLSARDYHHYCFIDDGYQGKNNYIPGMLHSVQPIACETYPVYTLNRRVWTLLATENFGPVVQTAVGALVVGGIYNSFENSRVRRGREMGHFELAGSTIVLLFQRDRICLLPEIADVLSSGNEYRVRLGMCIGAGK